MGRTLRISIGLVILILAGTAFLVSVYHVVRIGNCASGPYVSARECPDKTGWLVGGIFAGVIGSRVGTKVLDKAWAERDPRPLPITGLILGGFVLLLGVFGLVLVTGLADREAGPGWSWTGYIAAGIFVPVGLLMLVGASRRSDTSAGSASATPPVAASTDRLDRLEKLARLRAQGVLTDSEFQVEKAKILAGP